MLSLVLAPLLLASLTPPVPPQDAGPGPAQEIVSPPFAGTWEGEIVGASLAIELDLAFDDDTWEGTITIPSQRLIERALTEFDLTGDVLTFSIDGIPGDPTFEATFAPGTPDALAGPFRQGGAALTFRVERRIPGDGTLDAEALEGLSAWIEETRAAWKVPGLSVAIVTHDAVLLSEGFGTRGVDDAAAVDADTLFSIGSATKAFTTLMLGMEVEAGTLAWEDRVVDLLPGFGLFDVEAGRRLTLRDLVTHRCGLPRHDLMWYGRDGERTTREIVLGMRHLEPNAGLRERFQYNNLGFVAAGEVVAARAESTWHDQVRERILGPLGMARSRTTAAAFLGEPNHATGAEYRDGRMVTLPFRVIDHVAAAGAITSSANDMARWARLQLSGGSLDGVRLVRTATLADLHAPTVVVPELPKDPMLGIAALAHGWFVDGYRGHLRIQHGGNIDGYSAMVALFPNDDLGLVVLSNANGSQVPEFVVRHVADVAFGLEPRDWSGEALAQAARDGAARGAASKSDPHRVPNTSPAHPLAAYAGTYAHPGYGKLAVAAPERLTLTLGHLTAPLAHWHHDTFRVEAGNDPKGSPLEDLFVRFETDVAGDVVAVHVQLEEEVAPLRFARSNDDAWATAAALAAYAGAYTKDVFTITFELRGTELVGHVPGQPTRALVPVDVDRFDVDGLEGYSARFRRNAEGAIDSVELRQPKQTFVLTRD